MNKIIEFNILPFASFSFPINQPSINLAIGSVRQRARTKLLSKFRILNHYFFIFTISHLSDQSRHLTRLKSFADRSCIYMFATHFRVGIFQPQFHSSKAQ
ncbi:hypothetical protein D3C73_226490 [compost metagenome]